MNQTYAFNSLLEKRALAWIEYAGMHFHVSLIFKRRVMLLLLNYHKGCFLKAFYTKLQLW